MLFLVKMPTFAVLTSLLRPAPAELPQDRKVARVSGCSGAIKCACQDFFAPTPFFFQLFSALMKFFIDTANLDQIREAQDLGVLDGVTTNPSLMAKEGIRGEQAILNHYKAICEIVDGPISAEVLGTTFDDMVREGEKFASLHENIVVKVPMIKEGIKALKYFSDNGIQTNCTLVFSAGQAILAAKAGATYVSPFIGRIDDAGWDGIKLIEQIVGIFNTQGFMTEVLAASIRTPLHITQCAEAGADVVTTPLSSILGLLKHPLTDLGLEQFLKDAKNLS